MKNAQHPTIPQAAAGTSTSDPSITVKSKSA
jgi:hypothetical protein